MKECRAGGVLWALPGVIAFLMMFPVVGAAQEGGTERIALLRPGTLPEDYAPRLVVETIWETLVFELSRLDRYDLVEIDDTAGAAAGVDYVVSLETTVGPSERQRITVTVRDTRANRGVLTITEPLPTLFGSFGIADSVATRVVESFRRPDPGVDANTGADAQRGEAWQRDRSDLDSEHRELLNFTYYRDGRPQFTKDNLPELIPRSREILAGDGNASYTTEEYAALEARARRNVDTLVGIMLLAADYEVVLGRTADALVPYDVVAAVQEFGYSLNDRAAAATLVETYQRSVERRRPLWQVGLMAVGAIGVGTAGVIFGTGMPMNRVSEGEDLYDDYQAATDPDEAARLREATEEAYDEANTLFISGVTAGVVGLSALTTGILTRIRSMQRPQRAAEEFLAEAGEERVAAAISFFEDGDRNRLVVLRSATTVGAQPPSQPAPSSPAPLEIRLGDEAFEQFSDRAVYVDVTPGSVATIGSASAPDGAPPIEYELQPGRNIVFVP